MAPEASLCPRLVLEMRQLNIMKVTGGRRLSSVRLCTNGKRLADSNCFELSCRDLMAALHTSRPQCQLVTVCLLKHSTEEHRSARNGQSYVTAACLFLLPRAFNSRLAPSHGGVGGCEQQSVSRAVTVLKMTD